MRLISDKLYILVQLHIFAKVNGQINGQGTDLNTDLSTNFSSDFSNYISTSELDINDLEDEPGLRRRRNKNEKRKTSLLSNLLGFVNSDKNKNKLVIVKPKPLNIKNQYPEGLNPNKPIEVKNQYPKGADPNKPVVTNLAAKKPETPRNETPSSALNPAVSDRNVISENKPVPENKPIENKPISSNFKTKQKTTCIDLFWDLTQNIDLYRSIPIYGTSITNYIDGSLQFDYFSGVNYSPEHQSTCSGKTAEHGSICKLQCPDGKSFKNIPPRANTKDKKKFKFGQRPSHHQEFVCKCSGNEDAGSLCFWEMQEARWVSPLTCDIYLVNQWPVHRRRNVGDWWTNVLLQKRKK